MSTHEHRLAEQADENISYSSIALRLIGAVGVVFFRTRVNAFLLLRVFRRKGWSVRCSVIDYWVASCKKSNIYAWLVCVCVLWIDCCWCGGDCCCFPEWKELVGRWRGGMSDLFESCISPSGWQTYIYKCIYIY